MAAPNRLIKYVSKVLDLPHTYWDDPESKKLYGNTWSTGSSTVKLLKVQRKLPGKEQCKYIRT